MKAIDRARIHFSTRDQNRLEVPEWPDDEGNPLVVTWRPLTVKDRDRQLKFRRDYGETIETAVHIMIQFAKDEDGEPLFSLADKPVLMRQASPEVILRIAASIGEFAPPEALKKNSIEIPT